MHRNIFYVPIHKVLSIIRTSASDEQAPVATAKLASPSLGKASNALQNKIYNRKKCISIDLRCIQPQANEQHPLLIRSLGCDGTANLPRKKLIRRFLSRSMAPKKSSGSQRGERK